VQPAPTPQPTTVCLLSSDPLLMSEFQGLLYLGGFQFRTTILNTKPSTEKLVLPAASVYAIEARPTMEETESVLAEVLVQFPGARVIVIAADFSQQMAFPLLGRGVRGLVRRGEIKDQLSSALTAIAVGGFWVPRTLLARFVDSVIGTVRRTHFALGQAELTQQEQRLLDAILENVPDADIAAQLGISAPEVQKRVAQLASKFGVRRRDDLILLAYPKPA
jgi:DNA-binding NarL/FixJ family response regulator